MIRGSMSSIAQARTIERQLLLVASVPCPVFGAVSDDDRKTEEDNRQVFGGGVELLFAPR